MSIPCSVHGAVFEPEDSLATMTLPSPDIAALLEKCQGISMRQGVLGNRLTTFAIGGPIGYLVEPRDIGSLAALVGELHRSGVPFRMLGAGSNVLIDDAGVAGVVIRLGAGFRLLEPKEEGVFSVGASASVMRLSRDLSMAGFAGLEFAGGIPASFGGAIFMNAGAHGGELGNILERVEVVHADGSREVLERRSLAMEYRHGGLPEGSIVVRGEVKLCPSDKDSVAERRARFLEHRKQTQPLHLPSAGSVFRNPVGYYAGQLIEQSGLKGHRIGGAEISVLHANWIVNPERTATASDVRTLMARVIAEVRERHVVELMPEVRVW